MLAAASAVVPQGLVVPQERTLSRPWLLRLPRHAVLAATSRVAEGMAFATRAGTGQVPRHDGKQAQPRGFQQIGSAHGAPRHATHLFISTIYTLKLIYIYIYM